jgi:hypothetical protein
MKKVVGPVTKTGRCGSGSCFVGSNDGTRLCQPVLEPSDIARMRASLMETVRLGNQSGRFEKAKGRKMGIFSMLIVRAEAETERSSSILLHPEPVPSINPLFVADR